MRPTVKRSTSFGSRISVFSALIARSMSCTASRRSAERGGAGVRRLAGDGDGEPAAALDAGDDADVHPFGFEARPLLDMRLDIGVRPAAERAVRQVGLGGELRGQCVGEADAVGIDDIGERVELFEAAPGHAAHAAGGETAALLVGPGDDLDGTARRGAGVVQRGQRLQPGDHAVDAVEAAAVGLGVHVAAGEHGGGVRIGAVAAQPEIAGGVDRDRGADLARPADQQAARLAVELGEAGAVDAVAGMAPMRAIAISRSHCRCSSIIGAVSGYGAVLAIARNGFSLPAGNPLKGAPGEEPAMNDTAITPSGERQAFYERIGEHSLAPLWERLHAMVTRTPATPALPRNGTMTRWCGRS